MNKKYVIAIIIIVIVVITTSTFLLQISEEKKGKIKTSELVTLTTENTSYWIESYFVASIESNGEIYEFDRNMWEKIERYVGDETNKPFKVLATKGVVGEDYEKNIVIGVFDINGQEL